MTLVILGLAVWTLVVLSAIALCVEAARADSRAEAEPPVIQVTATGRFGAVA